MIEGYRVYVSFRGVYWEFSRSLIRKCTCMRVLQWYNERYGRILKSFPQEVDW